MHIKIVINLFVFISRPTYLLAPIRTSVLLFIIFILPRTALYNLHRQTVDVSHLITVPHGFLGLSKGMFHVKVQKQGR